MTNRKFHQRLERLENRVLQAFRVPPGHRIVFIHARDGKPSGLESVFGPDGRQVWSVPPQGCEVGKPVGKEPADPRGSGTR
jgi:hypothetical protein